MSRRRWVYTEGGQHLPEPIEVDLGWSDAPRLAQTPTEEILYGKTQATDGTDLSSRRKHREYMKRNGLAMTSDYQEHWKKAGAERDRAYAGNAGFDSEKRKAAIGQSIERLRNKGRIR